WVRDNIAQFGGDPASVTITGQSGGGGKCSHLMAMPSAKGLFHKVAIQSGSTLKTGRHEQAQRGAEALWTKLGVQKGDLASSSRSLFCRSWTIKPMPAPFWTVVSSRAT